MGCQKLDSELKRWLELVLNLMGVDWADIRDTGFERQRWIRYRAAHSHLSGLVHRKLKLESRLPPMGNKERNFQDVYGKEKREKSKIQKGDARSFYDTSKIQWDVCIAMSSRYRKSGLPV